MITVLFPLAPCRYTEGEGSSAATAGEIAGLLLIRWAEWISTVVPLTASFRYEEEIFTRFRDT